MSYKFKIITVIAIIGLVVLTIALNYVSSELYSLKYRNPIRKIYLGNVIVKAEVVSSKEKIEAGLSGRSNLSEGRGMFFVMPQEDFQRFWMKGMQFPIDIIWIENDRVIGCEEWILPEDQRIFTSPGKVGFVLEVSAGFCEKNQVQVNDIIRIR